MDYYSGRYSTNAIRTKMNIEQGTLQPSPKRYAVARIAALFMAARRCRGTQNYTDHIRYRRTIQLICRKFLQIAVSRDLRPAHFRCIILLELFMLSDVTGGKQFKCSYDEQV